MNMSIEAAYRRSIETVADWVDTQVDTNKTLVFFRSYSPSHFRFSQIITLRVVMAWWKLRLISNKSEWILQQGCLEHRWRLSVWCGARFRPLGWRISATSASIGCYNTSLECVVGSVECDEHDREEKRRPSVGVQGKLDRQEYDSPPGLQPLVPPRRAWLVERAPFRASPQAGTG